MDPGRPAPRPAQPAHLANARAWITILAALVLGAVIGGSVDASEFAGHTPDTSADSAPRYEIGTGLHASIEERDPPPGRVTACLEPLRRASSSASQSPRIITAPGLLIAPLTEQWIAIRASVEPGAGFRRQRLRRSHPSQGPPLA